VRPGSAGRKFGFSTFIENHPGFAAAGAYLIATLEARHQEVGRGRRAPADQWCATTASVSPRDGESISVPLKQSEGALTCPARPEFERPRRCTRVSAQRPRSIGWNIKRIAVGPLSTRLFLGETSAIMYLIE
jgi:hypothetical protein